MDCVDFILIIGILATATIIGIAIYGEHYERATLDDYSYIDTENNEGFADYCYVMKNGGMVCEKGTRTFIVKEYTKLEEEEEMDEDGCKEHEENPLKGTERGAKEEEKE